MWLLLLACAASTPAPQPGPAPEAAPPATTPAPGDPPPPATADGTAPATPGGPATVNTLLGEAQGVHFVGDWTSGPCGGRAYARNIHFDAENQYAGVDLVSPCPVGTSCVWSGLVGYAGVWVQEGDKLHLREIGGGTAMGGPHPTEFISTVDGTLVENGCTYTSGLTVPPGYEAAKVTPRVPTKSP